MNDPYIQNQLEFALRHCDDDLGYVLQFLEDIEPGGDKEAACVLILNLMAKHFPYILRYIVEDLEDRGAEDFIDSEEDKRLDDTQRLAELVAYDRERTA